ncbi:AAA family ATPase [Caulobacter sp. KR2-114]|uniref:AAA family ATPase n=1 Tax=Caulobacter sp. KR2-114 TaxID=3400912 RepID=UPI003C0C0889
MTGPTVVVLVGPKGAGKSYLAGRMRDELGYGYVDAERIWLQLRAEGDHVGAAFDDEGQRRILSEISERLRTSTAVVTESTAAAPWFAAFIARLEALAPVEFIRVVAPLDACLARIERRDGAAHLPASVDLIRRVHAHAEGVSLPWSLVVENRSPEDADRFLRSLPVRRRRSKA